MLALTGIIFVCGVSTAQSAEITSFSASLASTQAGAHADSNVAFAFATEPSTIPANGPSDPCVFSSDGTCQVVKGGAAKDIDIGLPKGMVGNLVGVPQCTEAELAVLRCPVLSQVGVGFFDLLVDGSRLSDILGQPTEAAMFNMVPDRGEIGKLGMNVFANQIVMVSLGVTGGVDPQVAADTPNVTTELPLLSGDLTIWGVPGDPSHDAERACENNSAFGCATTPDFLIPALRPFLSNPPECGTDETTTISVDTYQHPGQFNTATSAPQQLTGCEHQQFNPSIEAQMSESERGKPSGIDFDIAVPQTYDSPTSLATPPLRDAVVIFPEGVTISPGSADGLQACSDAQLQLDSASPVTCPDASRIGDVTVKTPLLTDVLTGGVYLRTQASNDPSSGDLFRIAIEIQDPDRGLDVKVPGSISVDPVTGRVTTRFQDSPQLPFGELRLHLKAGPRAPLALPATCGPQTISADLAGWGMSASSHVESTFVVTHNGSDAPCPRGFSPTFVAGSTNPVAGADTAFTLTVARSDDDQDIRTIAVHTPEGLLGRIASVPLCPAEQAGAGTCPASSRIGSVIAGAGSGTNPLYLQGSAYLTGPYNGGPFGLSIVVPANAGPFTLGNVIVRAGIQIDRHTATLRVISDKLPSIFAGVVLRVRSVSVTIDRSGFMINPTSCAEKRVTGTIGSTEGALAHVATRFQVGDCGALGLHPSFALRVGGKGHTAHGSSTPLTTILRMPHGGANLKAVSVSLPSTLNARLEIVNKACTQAQYDAGHCAAKAGTATAVTPLLKHALRGGVYFVKVPGARPGALPHLVVALRGQVSFDLVGKITIPGGVRLATKFDTVPDVPIKSFTLRLVPGANGPVGNAANLCSAKSKRATAAIGFRGQNGDLIRVNQRLSIAGCGGKKKH